MPDNERETEMVSSCRKLVTENCQRQLMTPMMMEALNIVRRGLAQQPQNFWYNFDSQRYFKTYLQFAVCPLKVGQKVLFRFCELEIK